MSTQLKTPDDFLNECRSFLENQPAEPEVAVWQALDLRQKQFILRGLGMDPSTFAMHLMTNHERTRLMKCIEAWAGTAERLRSIMKTCKAKQQAEHLQLVNRVDTETLPAPLIDQRKGQAA